MRALTRIIALWLLGVFAFFECGNTLFMHSHMADGHRVVHSHPYLPGSGHSHTDTVMQFMAAANLTASAMTAPESVAAVTPQLTGHGTAVAEVCPAAPLPETDTTFLRAPPAMC